MSKEELFEKYHINESHNIWEPIDNWMSVEIYRIMHNGNLPDINDMSVKYIVDFLDKINDIGFRSILNNRNDFNSIYLTSKRMIYLLSDEILKLK